MSWEIGLGTGIAYRHPIGDVLRPIAESGVRLIEISTAPNHLDLHHLDRLPEVRRQVAELGLQVHSLHAPFGHDVNITSPDPAVRRRSFERLGRAADALELLGGGLYVIHPGGEDQRWVWDRDARLALSVEGLTRVWDACRTRGLMLVVETPLPHLLGGQPADFDWILERLPAEGTGVCVDTSHTSLGGFLLERLERLGPRLVHIQASDNRGVTDDHLPPGEGGIDWSVVLSTLQRVGYRGVFMLEVAGDGDVRSHVQRAVAAARRLVEERAPA
ncbi:MAG TPA: sugar phosphate isomerase/epimerase family protein [Vicinamibacteria bacterium]|nr:sugar phosphate isomerase/epimerase family protein [Vicinamibacteria bacterium]